jgi:hypothetical protein
MYLKTIAALVAALAVTACNDATTGRPTDASTLRPADASSLSLQQILDARTPSSVVNRGGAAFDVVPDPTDPNTLTYNFDELAENCNFDVQLPNPYAGLVFLTTPFLASCVTPNETMGLVPANSEAYRGDVTYEVRILLPDPASAVSIEAYDVGGIFAPTLVAYDENGVVLASASDNTFDAWVTISVAVPGIRQIGLVMGQGLTYLDNLKITYVLNPTTKEACKDDSWQAFGFRNQGQCIRFVLTGKDSRVE